MARNAELETLHAQHRGSDRLAAKLRAIAQQAKATRSTGLHLPTLDVDPDADSPTNLWLLEDGRLRVRTADGTVHEFTPAGDAPVGGTDTTGGSTSTKPKPADNAPSRHQRVYSATWGQCFCTTHGTEPGGNLHYGTFPGSAHGMRRIMFGLNDGAIRSDLSGATIRKVELHLRNTDSWAHAGVDITFGGHNRDSSPGSFSAVRRSVWRGHWPESGTGATWRTVPNWFGTALRDNNIKGLTIDQPNGAGYYGECDWSSLQLRITYTS